jgi:hypothetical protein
MEWPRVGNDPPMLRPMMHAINGKRARRPMNKRHARGQNDSRTAEVIDVLSGVNCAREPVGFVAVAVPRIAVCVAIHHCTGGVRVGFERVGERFHRDVVFIHASAYPHDQALTRIPVEIELQLFFSLFHSLPMFQLVMLALDKQRPHKTT